MFSVTLCMSGRHVYTDSILSFIYSWVISNNHNKWRVGPPKFLSFEEISFLINGILGDRSTETINDARFTCGSTFIIISMVNGNYKSFLSRGVTIEVLLSLTIVYPSVYTVHDLWNCRLFFKLVKEKRILSQTYGDFVWIRETLLRLCWSEWYPRCFAGCCK